MVKSDEGHKAYGVVGRIAEVSEVQDSVRYILPRDAWVFVPFKATDDLFVAYTRKECLNEAMKAGVYRGMNQYHYKVRDIDTGELMGLSNNREDVLFEVYEHLKWRMVKAGVTDCRLMPETDNEIDYILTDSIIKSAIRALRGDMVDRGKWVQVIENNVV